MTIKRSHNSPPAAEENLLTPNPTIEETEKAEAQIRPQSLEDYIGQQDLKANLKVTIAAAKARQEAIDHLLFYGPPGLGKTTMALILAAEMGVNCRITAAPALERPRDITGILINLQPRDILFIDEIHRLNRVTEELLYPAMEDYRLDVTIGKGQAAKIRSISLPPFTLIGATTKVGSLTAPLRDRFGMIQRLRFYTVEELTAIMLRSATIFNIPITEAGAIEISRRSRGTPRIANRLLKRVRDYVQVKGETMITPHLAAEGLNQLNVDSMGLDWTDRLVLKTMIEQFQGKPVGLEAVAAATGEDAKTIEEVYEPYLLQIGYLNRTARGRVVTAAAYEHLGLLAKLPKNKDRSLPLFEF
ncbi:MAG: Holliday junction branch migration DNA helicase RuvB [Microcystis sp.]|jgi:Holliday junction DNA helicase RuvB|uniref:Holliday junction branch migration DNA helicase RuvB n=1 Tax=Microcystis sp. TaxID=1127 RepID=UPI0022C17E31|nr:Holliday junction branch migration DNA helicase RuvB [Microcystis sp. LE17-20D]MCZ8066696.1 Holliday junction branch migration DNA helicase RuvB [Microcystis sp. LE17-20D]MCZ8273144.1 Holliday junction branch migration DNA helicase RuvB [Microcystis sp. LE19-4.1E]